jgi:hypothetical protein
VVLQVAHGDRSPQHARRARLGIEVGRLFAKHEGRYGAPRITAELREAGERVSENTVAALLGEQGLAARPKRRRKNTTRPERGDRRAPDLIGRDFGAEQLNRKWYGDGTEITTAEGKLYLASVLDMASRRIVGFALGEHHDAELAQAALAMAIAVRGGKVIIAGVIFHTDQGSEGGFHRSSQHLMITEVLSGTTSAASGSGSSASDAVTWPANPGAACGARVLAPDRPGHAQRGCGARSRRVRAGRDALVSSRWRHAASEPCRAHRPVSVIQGT